MDSNSRLRRARVAHGVSNLDMDVLKRREAQRKEKNEVSLSARSSPGSPDSPDTAKSTGSSVGSPDKASRRPPPPERQTLPPAQLLPPPPQATTRSTSTTDRVSLPPPAVTSSATTLSLPQISTTEVIRSTVPPPPPPPAVTEVVRSTVASKPPAVVTDAARFTVLPPAPPPPPRITTTAFILPPPVANVGLPGTTNSPDSPSSSFSSFITSTTSESPSSTSTFFSSAETSITSISSASTTSSTDVVSTSAATSRTFSSAASIATSTSRGTTLSTLRSITQLIPIPTDTASVSTSTTLGVPVVTGAQPQSSEVATTITPQSETTTQPTSIPVTTGNGDNAGAKAGIALGSIAGVGMLAAIVFFFFKRYKRRQAYLDTSYADGSRDISRGGSQPTIFASIQERFHNMAAPVTARINDIREKGGSSNDDNQARGAMGGAAAGAAVGGIAGSTAASGDPKTQSQIINDMFQAAYAAENGMGDRNSAYGSEYPVDDKISSYYGQQEIPQATLRDSMSKWLRGSGIGPLHANPSRESSQSRFTAPSWTRSARSSTASSMLSEGDGVTAGVNSGLFPPGFRIASPLPPVPPLPPANMQSRWSESTRAPPETPSVSHDSLYSMYRRDTQISGGTDSGVPDIPEWWRSEQGATAMNGTLSPSWDARSSLQQPTPALARNGGQGIAARLESQERV